MDTTVKYRRIIVCGGRDFEDKDLLYRYLDFKRVWFEDNCVIISGAAKGADTLASTWASERGISCEVKKANWDDLTHPQAIIAVNKWGSKYNRNAGPIRNKEMLDSGADLVIAFPGGNGTANMIHIASEAGVKVIKVKRSCPR